MVQKFGIDWDSLSYKLHLLVRIYYVHWLLFILSCHKHLIHLSMHYENTSRFMDHGWLCLCVYRPINVTRSGSVTG